MTITQTILKTQLETKYQQYFKEHITNTTNTHEEIYLTNNTYGFIIQLTLQTGMTQKQKNYYNITYLKIRTYPVDTEYTYDIEITTTQETHIELFDRDHTLEKIEITPITNTNTPEICEVELEQMEEGFLETLGTTGTYIAVPTNNTTRIYLLKRRM